MFAKTLYIGSTEANFNIYFPPTKKHIKKVTISGAPEQGCQETAVTPSSLPGHLNILVEGGCLLLGVSAPSSLLHPKTSCSGAPSDTPTV